MRYDAIKNRLIRSTSVADPRPGPGDGDCAGAPGAPTAIKAEYAPGSFDCDCACDLGAPQAIQAQAADVSFDCDCACASDQPFALKPHAASGTWDGDCACAGEASRGRAGQTTAKQWIKERQAVSMPVGNGWRACFNPAGPVGVCALNAEAHRVLTAFSSPVTFRGAVNRLVGMSMATALEATCELVEIGLVRPVEGRAMLPQQREAAAHLCVQSVRQSTLSAWLHVVEACNLRCPYCYVHKQPQRMTLAVGHNAIDRLVEAVDRHGYAGLKLKYAGGEPTLNFSLIEALHSYAAQRTAVAHVTLEEVLLTNGVGVTNAMLNYIGRAGMRLMVSLDGGPEAHDRLRARPDGQSTYAAVTDTVERAMARGIKPHISITVTSLNLEGAGEAVAFALERDLPFNVNFYRECAPDNGQKIRGPLSPSPAELLEAMRGILAIIEAHPSYGLPLTAILDRTRLDIPHSHACSAGRDYLVVGTAGQVSACQMLLGDPWSTVASEDPLSAVRQRGEELFKAADDDAECGTCAWRTACSGGCPLLRKSVLHEDYCQVYRSVLPELVKLEAKRLIGQVGVPAEGWPVRIQRTAHR